MKLGKHLFRLYPRTWRARYEEELIAVLARHPLSFTDTLSLLVGACDAHLHPALGIAGLSAQARDQHLVRTLRRSLFAILCAYSGFVIAGFGFQKMTESAAFAAAARTHAAVGIPYSLVVAGSLLAVLALSIAGLPVAAAVGRYAISAKRPALLLLLAAPVLALIALCGASFLWRPLHVGPLTLAAHLPEATVRIVFLILFLAAAAISTVSVCLALARSPIPGTLFRFAVLPAAVLTTAMALMLAATLAWGLGLARTMPHLLSGNDGILGSSTKGTWLGIAAMMAVATGVAGVSLVRGMAARGAAERPRRGEGYSVWLK